MCALLSAPLLLLFSAVSRADDLPSDLALVPADSYGFAHIRIAELYRSPALKFHRDILAKAGAKAIEAFDQRFVPPPSTVDRLTVFVIRGQEKREPLPLFALAMTAAVNRDKFLKSALPNAKEMKSARGSYFADTKTRTGVFFVDDKTMLFGEDDALAIYLNTVPAKIGSLASGLSMAEKSHVTIALNPTALPPEIVKELPEPFRPLATAQAIVLGVRTDTAATLTLRGQYAGRRELVAAQDALKVLVLVGKQQLDGLRKELEPKVFGDPKAVEPSPLEEFPLAAASLFGLGLLEYAKELLDELPIKADGNDLVLSVKVPEGSAGGLVAFSAMGLGLALPAVQKVREAASRTASSNNLKYIGLALFNYESTYQYFPPAAICDKQGKPLLSWRVAILPYIEQENLYRQFKLDEPWDSEHNKKLIPMMPKIYASPRFVGEPGTTVYKAFVSTPKGEAFFHVQKPRRIAEITDGTSNTLMTAETSDPVIWTKPEDIAFDATKELPDLGRAYRDGGILVVMGDGAVRYLNLPTIKPKTLKAMITPNGGEVFDWP